MNNQIIEKLRTVDTDRFSIALRHALRDVLAGPKFICAAKACAYVLHRANLDAGIRIDSPEAFLASAELNPEIARFIRESLGEVWTEAIQSALQFEDDVLLAYILFSGEDERRVFEDITPVGVSKLAARILKLQSGDQVADYCTGSASFLRECFALNPDAHYFGNETNITSKRLALMRSEFLGGDIRISQENVFYMELRRFDKLFSNYPFNVKVGRFDNDTTAREVMRYYPPYSSSVSTDWVFNALMVASMSESGKAIGIMPTANTYNAKDSLMRRDFLDRGLIEAVIALPDRLFDNTAISTCMVVFSRNNKGVTLLDARNICEKGHKNNIITDENVEYILRCLNGSSELCTYKSRDELMHNDWTINPARYLTSAQVLEDGIDFESVIKSITRGTNLPPAQLSELMSQEPTPYRYLLQQNMQDGIIDDELQFLKLIDKRQEKYCLKNNALILSKNGKPFRLAIASVKPGEAVLACGNLYIIELDETKVDPYFIKAFFESKKGMAELNSGTSTAGIPFVSLEHLRRIQIPDLPIESQRELAGKYKAKLSEIADMKRKLRKAMEELQEIIEFNGEA